MSALLDSLMPATRAKAEAELANPDTPREQFLLGQSALLSLVCLAYNDHNKRYGIVLDVDTNAVIKELLGYHERYVERTVDPEFLQALEALFGAKV